MTQISGLLRHKPVGLSPMCGTIYFVDSLKAPQNAEHAHLAHCQLIFMSKLRSLNDAADACRAAQMKYSSCNAHASGAHITSTEKQTERINCIDAARQVETRPEP